jgi:hypothetical protein
MTLAGSTTVIGCWFHQIGWNASGIKSNPSEPGFTGTTHTQDIFIQNGAAFTITGNNFSDATYSTYNGINYGLSTAAIIIQPYDKSVPDVVGTVNISNNRFAGGDYMFYLQGQGAVTIDNNILGPVQYGYIYSGYIGGPWSWVGNVDLNGNTIAAPTGLPVSAS